MKANLSQLGSRQKPLDITRLMALAFQRPDILSLAAGFTDSESLPVEDVREIVQEISDLETEAKASLQYGSNIGRDTLRSHLASRIANGDLAPENAFQPDRLFITNGSQQALYLAVQTLCDPGDCILVEQPTYFVFLEILQGLGVEPIPMPMDDRGDVDVDSLRKVLEKAALDGSIEASVGCFDDAIQFFDRSARRRGLPRTLLRRGVSGQKRLEHRVVCRINRFIHEHSHEALRVWAEGGVCLLQLG